MPSKLRADRRTWAYPLAGLLMLGFVASACAEVKPLTREEQDKVDKAIARGVRFLKRVQQRPSGEFPNVTVPDARGKYFPFVVGATLVPALALLECGVPPDDPAVQRVAVLVRKYVRKLDSTYELSLALMFLDRLGEQRDEELRDCSKSVTPRPFV